MYDPIFDDPDNPEWTEADFARALPLSKMPAHIIAAFPRTAELAKTTGIVTLEDLETPTDKNDPSQA